jgi:CRP/FNR family transcriptional regulator
MFALHSPGGSFRDTIVAFPGSESSLDGLFLTQPGDTIAAGRAVFWEGDPANHVFQLTAGVLRLYRILPDGRRVISGFAFPGDVLGLAFEDRYLSTAEAITDVTIRRLSRLRLKAAASRSPQLQADILARVRSEACTNQDQVLLLLHGSADARIATFLLMVARRSTGGARRGTNFQLLMTRTDIADYLGLTIETVCRGITKLKSEGVVRAVGRHGVVVEKIETLRELSGEDEGTEHQRDRVEVKTIRSC